jgi:hypothetical protein
LGDAKKIIKTKEINIDNLNKLTGFAVTSSIKPEPIPWILKL